MRQNAPDPSSNAKAALREWFASLGLPPGLISPAYDSYLSCESRLWLLDNSSRMRARDSHVGRAGGKGGGGAIERVDNITRWEELRECVLFHAEMASKCWMPTKYWLVNDPAKSSAKSQPLERKFNLCHGKPEGVASEMGQLRHVMKNATLDQSRCPLTFCIQSLAKGLVREAPGIEARGRHVTLVMCTQGLPTGKHGQSGSEILMEFDDELSKFAKLPVKIVVRLCTDDERVRKMFNTLDSKFDSIDVLDDFWGESREVYLHNPWLTYTMGLHRLRESAMAPPVIDHLDEGPLSLHEIHKLCKMLLAGEDGRIDLPHPQQNWNGFLRALKALVDKARPQWNSIKKRLTPLIDLRKLEAMHGGGESSRHSRHSQHKHFFKRGVRRNSQMTTSQQQSPRSPEQTSTAVANVKDPALPEALRRWSHQPPEYELFYPLQRLLVTVPLMFPPANALVEPHGYFARWKAFDEEAFADEMGDELKELLRRAVRKAKFFLHPDKRPGDFTDNQTLLFDTLWHVILDRERVYLG